MAKETEIMIYMIKILIIFMILRFVDGSNSSRIKDSEVFYYEIVIKAQKLLKRW